MKSPVAIAGWWYTYLSEKYELVSWAYDIPTGWENKIHVPKHQSDKVRWSSKEGPLVNQHNYGKSPCYLWANQL